MQRSPWAHPLPESRVVATGSVHVCARAQHHDVRPPASLDQPLNDLLDAASPTIVPEAAIDEGVGGLVPRAGQRTSRSLRAQGSNCPGHLSDCGIANEGQAPNYLAWQRRCAFHSANRQCVGRQTRCSASRRGAEEALALLRSLAILSKIVLALP